MDFPFKIRNRWGYLIAFLMLLVSYFLIFLIVRNLAKESDYVSRSYDIINNLESIKAEITDAETGVRGYLITKDVRYLKPYNSGSKNVIPLLNGLRNLTSGNPDYQVRVDSLSRLVREKLETLSGFIVTFQQKGFEMPVEVIEPRESDRREMEKIRNLIQSLKEDHQVLMEMRTRKLDGFFRSTAFVSIISLLVALVTIFYSLITHARESKAKEEADENARIYSMELEDRIKELNKVNAELEELKSIEKFAATGRIARTIAHEVRNPLTNISLASEQLKEIHAGNEEADLLLAMVARNVSRINQLVTELLSATRIDQLVFNPVNINDLVDEALELATDRIGLNQIEVKKNYSGELCEILVDKEKVKLAFLNIIVNAIEAMDKKPGLLEITTSKLGNKCLVEFKDNGTGMENETRQKLFEPYFTGKPKGTGLGLTNTQNIILSHKGSISVRSRPGEGSTFIIFLDLNGKPAG